MEITLDVTKNATGNAADYYERSKKGKKRLEGAKKALVDTLTKIERLKRTKEFETKTQKVETVKRKKEWYEKFRWFVSSQGVLCVGGRDSTTNDILIKKHTEKDDTVFHTERPGSPFFIIKSEVDDITLKEVATATASYSRAWKDGIKSAEVYCVKGSQLKTEKGLPKGSFMIYGDRKYFEPELKVAIGIKDGQVIGGPVEAIKAQTSAYVVIEQGNEKNSDTAKKIKAKINGELEEIQKFIPAGGSRITRG
jgi:predicted ribosome quality control (RQC) complex YloA/Tae2 family protein